LTLRRWLLVLGLVLVAFVAAGVWYLFFRDDAPSAADIDEAARTLDEASTAPSAPPRDEGGLTGTWAVDPSVGSFDDFTGSWVGYRVREELAGIGTNVAVGRTPDVSGSVEIEATTVTAGRFDVDMTTLQSDEGFRDQQMHVQSLETDQFPDASFTITEPIELDEVPAEGDTVEVTATGDLLLHGVTNEVEIPLELVVQGDLVAVTGSLDVQMADYDITPPSSFRVVGVEDYGQFELQLFLRKS